MNAFEKRRLAIRTLLRKGLSQIPLEGLRRLDAYLAVPSNPILLDGGIGESNPSGGPPTYG